MFYLPALHSQSQEFQLPEEESAHCIRVLRKKAGDKIEILNGLGLWFEAQIQNPNPKKCSGIILCVHQEEPSPLVHLVVAPTKNMDRMEWLVEKGTELGCTRFSFISTKRTERSKINLERLQKIAIAAMKQSKRWHLPQIDELLPMETFLRLNVQGWVAHCHEDLDRTHIEGDLPPRVMIGPEGDFTKEELQAVFEAGYRPITLGNARLRTETAALKAIMLLEARG